MPVMKGVKECFIGTPGIPERAPGERGSVSSDGSGWRRFFGSGNSQEGRRDSEGTALDPEK